MSVCHVSVHPFVHVPIFRVSMRQCDLYYLLSARPARAFPDCTSSAHRPCIDHTKRIGEASTDRRTGDARYAWPAIRTTAERMRIADRVQSRPQKQPKNPHMPRTHDRQPTCDTLRRDAASSRPRLLTLETATPHTDEHHSISSAASPSRKGRTSRTATHNKRSPQHRSSIDDRRPRTDAHHDISPIAPPSRSSSPHTPPHATKHPRHTAPEKKRPVPAPTNAASHPTPPPAHHATKSRDSCIARPRETASRPLPPYNPTGAAANDPPLVEAGRPQPDDEQVQTKIGTNGAIRLCRSSSCARKSLLSLIHI